MQAVHYSRQLSRPGFVHTLRGFQISTSLTELVEAAYASAQGRDCINVLSHILPPY